MRKIATVKNNPKVKRAMLCVSDYGCYVFLYDRAEDGPCSEDYLQDSVEMAEKICDEEYGVSAEDWEIIPDRQPGCQQDWIATVRVVGRDSGNSQWGNFERYEEGIWKRINTDPALGGNS
jgi:hypothetical protein